MSSEPGAGGLGGGGLGSGGLGGGGLGGSAIVTGAARGIGAAVTARLAAAGRHVYAVDTCRGEDGGTSYPLGRREDLEAVAAAHPGRVTPVVADAADGAAMVELVTRVGSERGDLTSVVAAAAVIAGGDAQWETGDDVLDRLWREDLLTVWRTAHASLPSLLRRDPAARPAFVAVASAAGLQGLYHLSAYCTVKHAVVGLVRGLAADVTGTGVTVAAVCPGSTDTPMLAETARLYGLDDVAPLVAHQAVGRALDPDEVAGVVVHACTAGPVLAGAVLTATGGFAG
ncbi:mycofactocin-coupled SDR family oxidoreductase [Lapillicoccus jejuensis]|uniref:SDR family mycofactocin-dependent oxidoreductase n=1 Tax=Lapillicoccus jejuensis TaxID=402171 RepID=A0A542E3F6_9MICO|nr:mycofactocin-coupled SDR family oxidoreductase [Lapillicoccus jejuensis]TQJ09857.1 SDR family mycofactocin-dependent oxidoreductase [Lapillicoccus jejuensis]